MKPPSQTGCIVAIIVVTALAALAFFWVTRSVTLDLGYPPTTVTAGGRP